MTKDLAAFAKEKGVKYFMISYTDLFGGQRAKLVPTQAIADMQDEGAGHRSEQSPSACFSHNESGTQSCLR